MFRSAACTIDPTPDRLWISSGTNSRAARRLGIAHRPEPVEHRRARRIGIGVALLMRPVPFAGDDVLDAVAVDVGDGQRVQLA